MYLMGSVKLSSKKSGFSLIELLISLIILSLILIITSQFTRSSITINSSSADISLEIEQFQKFSSTVRRDIRNSKPLPFIDALGQRSPQVITIQNNPFMLDFTALGFAITPSRELVRIQLLEQNGKLIRRQFFSDQPYDLQEYVDLPLMYINEIKVEAFDGNEWHLFWPKSPIMERSLPKLIKLSLSNERDQFFELLLEVNNENIFQF